MPLSDILQMSADFHGGTFRKLKQTQLLRGLDDDNPSKKGVCRAISMVHSALRKQGSNIKGAAIGDKKYRAALVQFCSKLQEDVSVSAETTDLTGVFMENYERQAPIVGLEVVNALNLPWNCLDAITDFVTLSSDTHYLQVILPNHVIMAYPRPDGRAAFYDPNFGELEVDASRFRGALGMVYTHPLLLERYQLATGVDIPLVFLH